MSSLDSEKQIINIIGKGIAFGLQRWSIWLVLLVVIGMYAGDWLFGPDPVKYTDCETGVNYISLPNGLTPRLTTEGSLYISYEDC